MWTGRLGVIVGYWFPPFLFPFFPDPIIVLLINTPQPVLFIVWSIEFGEQLLNKQ